MRNELIQLDTDMGVNRSNSSERCQMLKLLLNQEVASFRFPSYLRLADDHAVTELWQGLLAEQPPGLHTVISSSHWNQQRLFFDSMLPWFPKLEALELGLVCNDVDLTNISEQLPNLR
jgi:hypothetical protein